MKQDLRKIETQIKKTRESLLKVGAMRPGSLSLQTRKTKKTTGEYWQLSFTFMGRGRTQYIQEESVKAVKKEIESYKRFKDLSNELVALSIEASQIRLDIAKEERAQNQ